jgi:predicted RNA-binding Zn ribbon-like protein
MAARQPAPAPLNVIEDFVNTLETDRDVRDERLPTPAALREWLEERDLIEPGAELTEADHARALRVREDLRSLLLAHHGGAPEAAAVDRLNETARGTPLHVRVDGPRQARLEASSDGFAGALGRIFAIVFGAVADGTWDRLKACRNEECTWVFYDASKNHSATWCSMRVCGNRMKARTYRRRRAEDHA